VVSYRLRDESGTTAIFVALILVVLMGFAAIAIDAAAAWALRRQDQSGADTGALAGALLTTGKSKAIAMQDAENEVIRITHSTMDPDMTLAEWTAEWVACTDTDKPAEFTDTLTSDCISFTSGMTHLRVRTPEVPWKTTFGQVLGIDEINTSAAAEVTTSFSGAGGVLPFAMPGGVAGDTEICLKTGANPKNVAPCDGPDTGNFGFLDFSQFETDVESAVCQGGGTSQVALDIARGVNHPLGSTTDPYAALHEDSVACNDGNFNSRPYHVDTETGNMAQVLDDGYAVGVGAVPGRLAQGGNTVNVRGHMLDDTPLWSYLNGAGQALCGSITTHDDLVSCLETYSPSNGVIFSEDIKDAPRFGWVPLFHETTLGTGTTTLTIREFRPVYIQTTLWGCTASSCSLEWDPGEPFGPGPNNKRIEASTAIQIPKSALPDVVFDYEPGTDNQVQYLLSK